MNDTIHRNVLPLLLGAGLLIGPGCREEDRSLRAGPTTTRNVAAGGWFVVGLQQDGQRVPIRNRQAVLQRKPFEVLMVFSRQPGVLVHASTDEGMLAHARSGRPLDAVAPLRNTVRAFRSRTLLACPDSYDQWYHYGLAPGMTKFDAAQRVESRGASALHCVKKIAAFQQLRPGAHTVDPSRAQALKDLDADRIHLVFVHAPVQPGSPDRVEQQRDWLTILFR
jgi:hypothetical protein